MEVIEKVEATTASRALLFVLEDLKKKGLKSVDNNLINQITSNYLKEFLSMCGYKDMDEVSIYDISALISKIFGVLLTFSKSDNKGVYYFEEALTCLLATQKELTPSEKELIDKISKAYLTLSNDNSLSLPVGFNLYLGPIDKHYFIDETEKPFLKADPIRMRMDLLTDGTPLIYDYMCRGIDYNGSQTSRIFIPERQRLARKIVGVDGASFVIVRTFRDEKIVSTDIHTSSGGHKLDQLIEFSNDPNIGSLVTNKGPHVKILKG